MPLLHDVLALSLAKPMTVLVAALAGAGLAVLFLRWGDRSRGREATHPDALDAEQQRLLRQILARTNILLWWGTVRREGDRLQWRVQRSSDFSTDRALPTVAASAEACGPWRVENVPELSENTGRIAAAVLAGEPSFRHVFQHVGESGSRWLSEEITIEPRGADTWALCGVVTDITERQEADAARQRSELRLQQILDRADCLLWSATVTREADGGHRWQVEFPRSELQQRIFGRDLSPAVTDVFAGLEVPEAEEIHARSAHALESGASGYVQEFRVIREGRTFWLSEQVAITPVAPGRWNLVGAAVDITERREAQDARRNTQAQLESLLQQADCLVWRSRVTARPEGGLCWHEGYFPRSALDQRLFGDPAAVRRFIWQPADVPELPEMNRRSAAAVLGGAPSYEQEFRFQRGGLNLWLHEHVTIQRDGEGGWSLVGVVTDVTERHRLREELQRASRLESVGFLAGGIAHDFNNILTAVMGNLAVAAMDAEGNASVIHHLEEAEKACVRARDLTQQLLTFAKGGAPIRTAVHLPSVIRECAEFALHGACVSCDFQLPEALWPANADKSQVGQIVQNLVINAAQAMSNGGRIILTATNETMVPGASTTLAAGDYVHLTVKDSGPGIPAADLARVFDPYFTTKKQGSGLGLATVYSIVKRHQGAVAVESTFGAGATFHVWLPALPQGMVEAPGIERGTAGTRLQGRVLVMDDEQPVRLLAAKLAQRLGLEADTAADGQQAITLCQEALDRGEAFDIVVMDLTIPGGMGGAEAIGHIRRLQPTIGAVVSSGYSSDPIMANHAAHGFDAVVAKPYRLEEFGQVLRRVLERRPTAAASVSAAH